MRCSSLAFLLTHTLGVVCQAVWSTSPFNPPALPLAVRSPYFGLWLPQGSIPTAPFDTDPFRLFETAPTWYASAVVDDKEYRLLGQYDDGEGRPSLTKAEFTATRTSFIMTAGGMQFNMTFLSPVEARNFTLLSMPFSYLYIHAQSIDGNIHRVQLYSDVEGLLICNDATTLVAWAQEDTEVTSDYIVLSMTHADQENLTGDSGLSKGSTAYHAFRGIGGTKASWSISSRENTRGVFVRNPSNGTLNNQADSGFRAASIGDDTPVLGIAIDWDVITATPEPAVWAIGVVCDPSVQYRTPEGTSQNRRPYFMSTFHDSVEAIKFFLDDFSQALSRAQSLDNRITDAGNTISSEHSALLSLSTRQVMGLMDVTLSEPNDDGHWDTENVRIFMKNIGGVGYDHYRGDGTVSISTVDTLYLAFPAFLYLNHDIVQYLLTPLLELQDLSSFTLPYAATDLGLVYPHATADNMNNPHDFGIDTSSNLIIMSLAYSLASGNNSLLNNYYDLFEGWAEYLVDKSMHFTNQSSSDFSANSDFTRDNQANLLLKGIIAISAMAKIAKTQNSIEDENKFNNASRDALENWMNGTVSSSRFNFVLNDSSTSGMMYNLYADMLLHLQLVPAEVYEACSRYYSEALGDYRYGVPLTSSPDQNTTTYGMMFAAATTADPNTRRVLISKIFDYASNGLNMDPFSTYYSPSIGVASEFASYESASQGAIFALLAVNVTGQGQVINNSTEPSSSDQVHSRKRDPRVIVAAVIGAVLGSCGITATVYFTKGRCSLGNRRHMDLVVRPQEFSRETTTRGPHQYPSVRDSPSLREKAAPNEGDTEHRTLALQRIAEVVDSGGEGANGEMMGPDVARASRGDHDGLVLSGSEPQRRDPISSQSDNIDRSRIPTREEFDGLRRELESLRQERMALGNADAPPSYSNA